MQIRPFDPNDLDATLALWESAELLTPHNDPRKDIARKLDHSPWGFLVMVEGDAVIGSVMAGYDGHRGWINYLACHQEYRRRGVATALLSAAQEILSTHGCPKINLQVREGNQSAIAFYESLGYSNDTVTSFGLRLVSDG